MVRPKLVQEGVPLYGPGSEAHGATAEDETMDMQDNHATPAQNKNLQRVSSLQKAASSISSRSSKKVVATTCTIGGDRDDAPARQSSWRADSTRSLSSQSSTSRRYSHTDAATYTITPRDGSSSSTMDDFNQYQVGTQTQYQVQPSMDHEMMVDDTTGSSQNYQHGNHYTIHHQHAVQHQQNFNNHQPAQQYEIQSVSCTQQHQHQHDTMPVRRSSQPAVQTSHVIGGGEISSFAEPPQKMEGVEDLSDKQPLVVLDGANVAYAYANAMQSSTSLQQHAASTKPEPDAVGIQVATDYFRTAGLRVLVVLPQYWFRSKPKPGDTNSSNALMETPHLEALEGLKAQGLIVASPPADDDDAYALTISRREESRSLQRDGQGPGFVVSNDMFRDAQQRDPTLKDWLTKGRDETTGPGRISYTFCDMGTMNDHGERILDFVPNPRHPLVIWTESIHHRPRS